MEPVNLRDKLARFATHWDPKIVGELNGQHVKLAKLLGEFDHGSIALGGWTPGQSDIDLLVDLVPGGGNELLRVAGISEELSNALGVRVDVVAPSLLRREVSTSARHDAVTL